MKLAVGPVAVTVPSVCQESSARLSQYCTVKVRPGDSASKIAMTHKLADVSLDQMLVAIQRGNPNAFIEGNINRIKAGSIVALPTEKQATAVSATQASQIRAARGSCHLL